MVEGWESDVDFEDERDEVGDDEGNGLGYIEFVNVVFKVILVVRWNYCCYFYLILFGF